MSSVTCSKKEDRTLIKTGAAGTCEVVHKYKIMMVNRALSLENDLRCACGGGWEGLRCVCDPEWGKERYLKLHRKREHPC